MHHVTFTLITIKKLSVIQSTSAVLYELKRCLSWTARREENLQCKSIVSHANRKNGFNIYKRPGTPLKFKAWNRIVLILKVYDLYH